jgi:signal peptidase I
LVEAVEQADEVGHRLFPKKKWDEWTENVEVFLVAIVVALAIQAYFVKPFKIPTDSMKPTLYGIQAVTETEAAQPPIWPVRIFELVVLGRSYVHLQVAEGGTLYDLKEGRFLPWFEYTDLFIGEKKYRVWVNRGALQNKAGLQIGKIYAAGEVVLHFRHDTGDQVLVNKVSYNFRKPQRGEVFVFKTTGIEMIESSLRRQGIEGSQYYIKRCVGVPRDELRIEPPYLYVNGAVPHTYAFDRIYSQQSGYRGYTILSNQQYLSATNDTHRLAADEYWAMGDNSFNSLDSRFWGPVVRENLVGTALMVYWPFGPRWGLIR